MNKEICFERILLFIILSGVLISFYTLLMNRSLWHDEAKLGLNIVTKSYGELLRPLDRDQVAPIGFLWVEKTFTLVFGNEDYALRIFPFIAFIISIPLFYSLSKKITRSKSIALLACAVYSLNLEIIYYSSEVKQYLIDVLIGLLIFYAALLHHTNRNKNSLIYYSVIGAIAIWFSNTAVIMLFVIGLYSIYKDIIAANNRKILIPITCWLASFILYYGLFVYNHPSREFMVNFWNEAFLPLNPFSQSFYAFLLEALYTVFAQLFNLGKYWIAGMVITLAGCIFLFREKRFTTMYLLTAPILVHLALSGLKLYPFAGRLILYSLPLLILLFVIGFHRTWKFVNEHLKIPAIFLLFPVIMFYYPLVKRLPIQREEIQESMEFMNRRIEKEDRIYVYYAAAPAFDFYKNEYPALQNIDIVYGNEYREDRKKYFEEVLNVEGEVWLLFSHVYPFGGPTESEEQYILRLIKASSCEILAKKASVGASTYEIDECPPSTDNQ